jgi:hypothetical protein
MARARQGSAAATLRLKWLLRSRLWASRSVGIARCLVGLSRFALAAALVGCGVPPASPPRGEATDPPWFEDITNRCSLVFVHDAGPTDGRYFLPQITGSGAALFDYDNDGRLDVYLVQNGGPGGASNRLFHQEADGRFTDVSKGSGLDVAGYGMGVAVGDVNNDGWPDILLTEYGCIRLFVNNGNGTFTDVTREAGLDNPGWGASAAFFDYDRDGWLDLVVVNYVAYDPSRPCGGLGGQRDYCTPRQFEGSVTRLFHNLGPPAGQTRAVRFRDVTVAAGLARAAGPGLGVACADFDGDGWPDILVANDGRPNYLWINRHDGTFTEEGVLRGVAYNGLGLAQANMGVALGDLQGRGLADLFVTHLTEETPTLWVQGPRGTFGDATGLAGLASPRWQGTGFGTVLGDFDHDGTLDVAVVNGRVRRRDENAQGAVRSYWEPYQERNQLFANRGGGRFRDVSPANGAFCGPPAVARGLCCGDIDGDGALDLLVTTVAGPARLYRNVAPKRGHWLLVRAVDPALHRDAYGAEIAVRTGERRRVGWVNPGQSYLCSNAPQVHFGLGDAERVDSIGVHWPDGTAESFPATAADQSITLRRGTGKPD